MQNLQRYREKDARLFEAVRKLQTGDDSSTNDVYELSEKYIYKIINDIVKNHQTTEDLMQETYLQVYNKIETLQSPEAFYVWAGRIATNLTLRHIQKYRKETLVIADEEGSTEFVFESAAADQEAFIPETVLDNKETQRLIAAIVDSLSIEQKLSVQYFYYEEMSVKEIAAAMGCSEGTVKSRLNYARKSIKEAVIDLDVKQGTRLYSLASMPLFLLVFRAGAEELIIGAAAAAGVAGTGAAAVAGGNAGAAGAGMTGSAGVVSGAAGAGAMAGTGAAGGAAAGVGAAGVSGGAAAGIGSFFATTAGKAVAGIMAAAVIGGGAYVATQPQPEPEPVEEVVETAPVEIVEPEETIEAGSVSAVDTEYDGLYSDILEFIYGELNGTQAESMSYVLIEDENKAYIETYIELASGLELPFSWNSDPTMGYNRNVAEDGLSVTLFNETGTSFLQVFARASFTDERFEEFQNADLKTMVSSENKTSKVEEYYEEEKTENAISIICAEEIQGYKGYRRIIIDKAFHEIIQFGFFMKTETYDDAIAYESISTIEWRDKNYHRKDEFELVFN